jgi:hypothetical protein
MTRNTAAEISKYGLAGLSIPFFRMPLMRSRESRQHERLIELEKKFPNTVLYVSPCLRNVTQFDLAYRSGNVHERSMFFSPTDIGLLPDTKDHSVAYHDSPPVAYFRSEPWEIKAMTYETLAGSARELFHRPQYSELENASAALREAIRSLVSPRMRGAENELAQRITSRRSARPDGSPISPETDRTIENILVAREMARIDLSVEVIVAQPRK